MLQIKYILKFYKDININDNNGKHTDLLYYHAYDHFLKVYPKLKPSESYMDNFYTDDTLYNNYKHQPEFHIFE